MIQAFMLWLFAQAILESPLGIIIVIIIIGFILWFIWCIIDEVFLNRPTTISYYSNNDEPAKKNISQSRPDTIKENWFKKKRAIKPYKSKLKIVFSSILLFLILIIIVGSLLRLFYPITTIIEGGNLAIPIWIWFFVPSTLISILVSIVLTLIFLKNIRNAFRIHKKLGKMVLSIAIMSFFLLLFIPANFFLIVWDTWTINNGWDNTIPLVICFVWLGLFVSLFGTIYSLVFVARETNYKIARI